MSESKHTAELDAIMELVDEYAKCAHDSGHSHSLIKDKFANLAREDAAAAICALVKSRHQAARQVADVQSWIQERWSVCRNLDEVTHDRDALREQVQRLEVAIRDNWQQHGMRRGLPAYSCFFCNEWAFKGKEIEHSKECVTRLTKGTREE